MMKKESSKKMSRRMKNNINVNEAFLEKKTRRGRPYSPYTIFYDGDIDNEKLISQNNQHGNGISSNNKKSGGPINNNINDDQIEESHLIAQIIEDARQSKRHQNHHQQQQQQEFNHHHHPHKNLHNNLNSKKVPFDQTAYRDIASINVVDDEHIDADDGNDDNEEEHDEIDDAENAIDELLRTGEFDNLTRKDTCSDENDVEIIEDTSEKSHESSQRSDSVIFTGKFSQHDIELEEISRIRSNGKSLQI